VQRRRRAGRVEAEPGEPAGFERRHQERVVPGVRRQPARAEQPGAGVVRVRRQHRPQRGQGGGHVVGGDLVEQPAVDVHVRPGAELVRRRQRGVRVSDGDERQRPLWAHALVELGLLVVRVAATGEHDQGEPRCQAGGRAVRRCGAVPPREVLVVELDVGQQVRLGVGDPGARLGAGDRPRVHADDVARSVQLDQLGDIAGPRVGGRPFTGE
jgi:hypothetical protein